MWLYLFCHRMQISSVNIHLVEFYICLPSCFFFKYILTHIYNFDATNETSLEDERQQYAQMLINFEQFVSILQTIVISNCMSFFKDKEDCAWFVFSFHFNATLKLTCPFYFLIFK